jgi:hypothetical protein
LADIIVGQNAQRCTVHVRYWPALSDQRKAASPVSPSASAIGTR